MARVIPISNFLIPQLAADLHYKKGLYYAYEGDFASVGTSRIAFFDEVPASALVYRGGRATAACSQWEDGTLRRLLFGAGEV